MSDGERVAPRENGDSVSSWLERHAAAMACCAQRPHDHRYGPVYERGSGTRLWDTLGHEYFDLTCGYSANNFGHAHPGLVQVLQSAAMQLGHLTGDPHVGKIRLAERLLGLSGFRSAANRVAIEHAPEPLGKVVFNTSGGRAVEAAWKAASSFRPGRIVSMAPAFHGRTISTAPLSDTQRSAIPFLATTFEVRPSHEYPYCGRCPMHDLISKEYPQCELACSQSLFRDIEIVPDEISAVIVEPALGARGYIFPPASFMQRLRDATKRHGVLMIADEVQTGVGRCGDWMLSHRQSWQPDLIVLGKSLGGGLIPISAVVGRADILDAIPSGAESETYSATPLACAVALAVLDLLADGAVYCRADELGEAIRGWFIQHPLLKSCGVGRVEGVGASCVLEFTQPDRSSVGLHPVETAARLARAMFQQRLLVHLTGPELTRIVFLPPLSLSDAELHEIFARCDRAMASMG